MLYGTIILPVAGLSQIVRHLLPLSRLRWVQAPMLSSGGHLPPMIIYHIIGLFLPRAAFDMQLFIFHFVQIHRKKAMITQRRMPQRIH
jgi:hypothetical protein